MITQRYKGYTIEVKISYEIVRPDQVRKQSIMGFTSLEDALDHAVEAINDDIQNDGYNALTEKK